MFKRNNPDSKRAPLKKKKRRKVKKSTILILTGIALAIAACGFGIWYFVIREPENQTLTSLDEISLGDLQTMPQAEFNDEDSIEVKDYTIYGTSLVFYDRIFEPMETDGFFGRNVHAADAKGGIESQRACGDGLHVHLGPIPQTHDGTLAEVLIDLRQGGFQGFFLVGSRAGCLVNSFLLGHD